MEIKMIVFGRGHVVVAECERRDDPFLGPVLHAAHAVTIRVWGTSKGLGELADGPAKATLDPIPHGLAIPISAVHGFWPISPAGEKKWAQAIGITDLAVLR